MASKRRRRVRPPLGAAPEVVIPPVGAQATRLVLTDFTTDKIDQKVVTGLKEVEACKNRDSITWLDVQGLGDLDMIRKIGDLFGLHTLAIADVVHVPQLHKFERYGDWLFFIGHVLQDPRSNREDEQVSLFLGPGWVLSFQERAEPDSFAEVRQRLRDPKARIRNSGADYLAYALLDVLVDSGFLLLDSLREDVHTLEEQVLACHDHTLARIQDLRRRVVQFEALFRQQRKAVNQVVLEPGSLLTEAVRFYLRDVHDHAVEQVEVVQIQRESLHSLRDLHLSLANQRLNEVMRFLTVMSTIFMPLSFFASVYGMNFSESPLNMPELTWRYGYIGWWVVTIAITITMLLWIRRRGWLTAHFP